jgi:hypothetical protein
VSAISITELKHLLRAYLTAQADVKALVGDNVFGAHLEDADAQTVLEASPLAVYEFLSGVMRWHKGVALQTMDLYAYSKQSGDAASQLYDALTEALQHQRVIVAGIDPVALPRETQRPLDGYNAALDAWYVRGRWTLEVS